MSKGWVGFDLDGTLSYYKGWEGPDIIGPPIQPVVDRVKELLKNGIEVRIFTARVCSMQPEDYKKRAETAIKEWCKKYIGTELPVTAEKDYNLLEYYDDRAVSVICNTGIIKEK